MNKHFRKVRLSSLPLESLRLPFLSRRDDKLALYYSICKIKKLSVSLVLENVSAFNDKREIKCLSVTRARAVDRRAIFRRF